MKLNLQKKFKSIQELGPSLIEILEEDPIRILYDINKDYITYQIEIATDETDEQKMLEKIMLLDVKELLNVSVDVLFKLSCLLDSEDLYITHIMCGNKEILFDKFSIETPVNHIMGAKIHETEDLPKEVILFIVSNKKSGDIPDFQVVFKGQ